MAGVTLDRTWREESADPCDTPWYLDHRWVSLALLVLTVAVVVPFR